MTSLMRILSLNLRLFARAPETEICVVDGAGHYEWEQSACDEDVIADRIDTTPRNAILYGRNVMIRSPASNDLINNLEYQECNHAKQGI